jgi:hypothetical protein
MQIGVMPDDIQRELLTVEDPLRREQYLDFLKGRMFRQTLLCRAAVELDRTPRPQRLLELAVSSPAQVAGREDGRVTFTGPGGCTLTTDHPLVVRALERIGASWPAALHVGELAPPDGSPEDREAVCESLLRCYAANLVQLHTRLPAICVEPGERPQASPLARLQARDDVLVTNLRHMTVRLEDAPARQLVMALDGTRDRAALMVQLAGAGGLPQDELAEGLERGLRALARLALLA